MAFAMFWRILWPLVLGFTISGVVQAVVSKDDVARRLGRDRPRALVWAPAFGAASSSCSCAAVAIARSLFRKGADFTAAMVFEIASTNLVVELTIISPREPSDLRPRYRRALERDAKLLFAHREDVRRQRFRFLGADHVPRLERRLMHLLPELHVPRPHLPGEVPTKPY
jgi:Predicted permease